MTVAHLYAPNTFHHLHLGDWASAFPEAVVHAPDLVHNVGHPEGAWARLYAKAMGFHDRVAMSRMIRWTGFADRREARAALDRVLDLPFERIVVGHGAPILEDAREELRDALTWL